MLAVAARYALTPLAGTTVPYAFVFAGVAIAAVAGGWRAGLVAMVAGQAMTLLTVIEPTGALIIDEPHQRSGFVVATLSQLLLLGTIALYQREVDKGAAEREARLTLLDEALKEIDHRTRNNYQTVLAMVELQARRATDTSVQDALRQVADRIQAVANASQQLALRSAGLDAVRLDDHLCGLVEQIERGLSREDIRIACEVDDVTASPEAATSISIIVNELVTNALKHAFNGEGAGNVWVKGKAGRTFELIVSDNGRGIRVARGDSPGGLGTKLVESFARQLSAHHEMVSSEEGTTHRLVIPRLA